MASKRFVIVVAVPDGTPQGASFEEADALLDYLCGDGDVPLPEWVLSFDECDPE